MGVADSCCNTTFTEHRMQRSDGGQKRNKKSEGDALRKGRNVSGEIRPNYAGRPGSAGKKWWDPIADVVFPHRAVRKKQELRRRNTMGPEALSNTRGGYSGRAVHPTGHQGHGMYVGFMPPHHPGSYPPQPHPGGYLPPPPPHSMYPFYGMPHRPSVPYLPGDMSQHYPHYGQMSSPYDDTESEVSVMDPSFYANPSEVGKSQVSSSRRGVIAGSKGGRKSGHRKNKPPPILQPPDPLAEGYNTLGPDDISYESDGDKGHKKTSPDNDLIKGFDDFMLY